MRGSKWGVPAAIAAVLIVAAPAPAQEEEDPDAPRVTWTEACGDAATLLRTGRDRVDVGDTRNSPLDIRTVEARQTPGGLQMRMDVCGPLQAPDGTPRTWNMRGQIAGTDCRLILQLSESLSVEVGNSGPTAFPTRSARSYVSCLDRRTMQSSTVASVTLPAESWSVDGAVVRIRLARATAGAVAGYIPKGTVITELQASTFDVRSSPVPAFSPQNVTVSVHTAGRDEAAAAPADSLPLG